MLREDYSTADSASQLFYIFIIIILNILGRRYYKNLKDASLEIQSSS